MQNGRLTWRLTCAAALLFGISVASDAQDTATLATTQPTTIRLMVGVAWEGRDLLPHNIDALKEFRRQFSDVAVVHFLSPAYFTKPAADKAAAQAMIRSVFKPGDQLAMTLGGWKSLATSAGVIFRSGPTFWGQTLKAGDCAVECGQDIPVNVYPEADLAKLFKNGLDTLDANGFGRPKGLMTEGWVASPQLLEAAARAGIRYDFSAVAAELIFRRAHNYPLYQWVKGLWPAVTPHTQPFVLTTGAGALTEIPQSTAALDYLVSDDVVTIFKEYVDQARKDATADLTFPVMIYQETAKWTVPRLERTLQGLFAYAAENDVGITPLVLPGLDLPKTALPPAEPIAQPPMGPPLVH